MCTHIFLYVLLCEELRDRHTRKISNFNLLSVPFKITSETFHSLNANDLSKQLKSEFNKVSCWKIGDSRNLSSLKVLTDCMGSFY